MGAKGIRNLVGMNVTIENNAAEAEIVDQT